MNERLESFDEADAASATQDARSGQVWDAIVVGAGAAGAVFARDLTAMGLRVLMLELGKHYQDHRSDFTENELGMWEHVWDNGQYEVSGSAFTGAPNLGRGVGGGTLAWTAVSLPFFEHDFRMRSSYGCPQGASVEDWPIGFDDLEPFYFRAEKDLGVSGSTMPWERRGRPSRPFPPFPPYRSSQLLQRGMDRLSIRHSPGPVAIASVASGSRSKCVNCGFCRSGCRIDAKYQADHTLIKAASATGRLKIIDQAYVTRINHGRNPKVASGVSFIDVSSGVIHSVKGRLLFICNNPIEIPRLFLNSVSAQHPVGMANHFGTLGRHLLSHPSTVAVGVTNECLNTSIGFTMGNVLSLDFGTPRKGQSYYGGFALESLHGAGAGVLAVDPYAHLMGSELKTAMRSYNNSIFAIAFCEGLPVADNRVTVDPHSLDAFGIPKAKIHYEWHPNDLKVLGAAKETLRRVLTAAGAHAVHLTDKPFEAHPGGTMRMGRDPRSSVTDSFGKVHGMENVYVGGAALFVTSSSVNPTLTLHALALRTTQHIKRRFGL